MLICAFPPHYQLVCANSYISSFSLISYVATVALSALKCGSFANPKSPNEKIGGLFWYSEAGFPFWLKTFGGCTFVDIIHHHPASCGESFHRFLSVCAIPIFVFASNNGCPYIFSGKAGQPAATPSRQKQKSGPASRHTRSTYRVIFI